MKASCPRLEIHYYTYHVEEIFQAIQDEQDQASDASSVCVSLAARDAWLEAYYWLAE